VKNMAAIVRLELSDFSLQTGFRFWAMKAPPAVDQRIKRIKPGTRHRDTGRAGRRQ
jgi:hypothetical protein